MKDKTLNRLLALIEVKSIITLILIAAAVGGFFIGVISGEVFSGWVGMVLVYFFNKDKNKEV